MRFKNSRLENKSLLRIDHHDFQNLSLDNFEIIKVCINLSDNIDLFDLGLCFYCNIDLHILLLTLIIIFFSKLKKLKIFLRLTILFILICIRLIFQWGLLVK